jgi:hypothetical protein
LKKKSYKERKKIIQENIIAIHNVFFNDRAKFSTSSILKKISKNNFEKNIQFFFKKRSQSWENKKNKKVNIIKIKDKEKALPRFLEYC